jgi:hypothetical protein
MKSVFRIKAAALAVAVAAAIGGIAEVAAQSSSEIFVPVLVYRTGAVCAQRRARGRMATWTT